MNSILFLLGGLILIAIGIYLIYAGEKAFWIFGYKENYKKENPSMAFWGWYILWGLIISFIGGGIILILLSLGIISVVK